MDKLAKIAVEVKVPEGTDLTEAVADFLTALGGIDDAEVLSSGVNFADLPVEG